MSRSGFFFPLSSKYSLGNYYMADTETDGINYKYQSFCFEHAHNLWMSGWKECGVQEGNRYKLQHNVQTK